MPKKEKTSRKKIKITEIKSKIKIIEKEEPKEEPLESQLEEEVEESSIELQESGIRLLETNLPSLPLRLSLQETPQEETREEATPGQEEQREVGYQPRTRQYFTQQGQQANQTEEERLRGYETDLGRRAVIRPLGEEQPRIRRIAPLGSQSEFETITEQSINPPIRTEQEHLQHPEERKYENRSPFGKKKKVDMY